MIRPLTLLIVLLAVSVASLFGALLIGTFPISALQVLDSVLFPAPGVAHDVIWRLRAPRAAAAFASGGLFALAGLLVRIVFDKGAAYDRHPASSIAIAAGALVAFVAGVSLVWMQPAGLAASTVALLAGSIGCLGLTRRAYWVSCASLVCIG